MMIEKQCKSGIDLPKGSSSTSDGPSTQVAEPVQNSPAKGHLASQGSDHKTEDDMVKAVTSSTEKVVERQKSPQNEVLENLEANVAGTSNSSPPSKRAKRDEQA